MSHFKSCLSSVAVICAMTSSLAYAQQAPASSNFYVGAGVAYTSDNELRPLMRNSTSYTRTQPKIYGGYQFNQYLATELQWTSLTKQSWLNPLTENSTMSLGGNAISISALGFLPVSTELRFLGKIGVQRNLYKTTGVPADYIGVVPKSQNALLLGIGAEYQLTKNVALRLDYDYTRELSLKKNPTKLLISGGRPSLGIRYIF